MTIESTSLAVLRFVDYFGDLGPRWGLPAVACRVHAYLYLVANPVSKENLATALSLEAGQLNDALAFLVDYRMVDRLGSAGWRTSGDPWDMLLRGLEQRRRRELPAALSLLRESHHDARTEVAAGKYVAGQIGKMLELVEDLAAIDAQTKRLSPQFVRGLVGISGRAVRFMDRALSPKGRRQ